MNNQYSLVINNGVIGMFENEQIALRYYRDIIMSGILVLSAYIAMSGKIIRRII